MNMIKRGGVAALTITAVLALSACGGTPSGFSGQGRPADQSVVESTPTPKPSAPKVELVAVPGLVGQRVAGARATLEGVGLVTVTDPAAGDDWIVVASTPGEGVRVKKGEAVGVIAEAPKPQLSIAQKNAVAKGESYLSFMGFSRSGLIGQLEYEGFSTEDATFAADYIAPDWNAECAEKAKSYMEFQSFSRDGLYDQLAYEGFADSEIQAGLAAVGY